MKQLSSRFTTAVRNAALVGGIAVFSAGQAMAAAIPINIEGIQEQIGETH